MFRKALFVAAIGLMAACLAQDAQAGKCRSCRGGHGWFGGGNGLFGRGATTSWHGNYYYTQYGMPVPLVVPPTVHREGIYQWGAPSSGTRRIRHQFSPTYPGNTPGSGQLYPTPYWPSHTDQFGVYYVRGPWK